MDKREYKKCVTDDGSIYLIEKYLLPIFQEIKENKGLFGNKKYKLTDYQKNILKCIGKGENLYINKGRNVGVTSIIILKIASDIILSEGNEVFLFYCCNNSFFNSVKNTIKEILLKCSEDLWTYIPQFRKSLIIDDKYGVKEKPYCKEDLIFNTNNFGEVINGFETSNGCVFKQISSPSDICVNNNTYIHNGLLKNVKYAVMDEWVFKDNAKIMLECLRKENITTILDSTPKCDTDLCYNIAKEFKDLGLFIDVKWTECPWIDTKDYNNELLYNKDDLKYLSESGKIFKIEFL